MQAFIVTEIVHIAQGVFVFKLLNEVEIFFLDVLILVIIEGVVLGIVVLLPCKGYFDFFRERRFDLHIVLEEVFVDDDFGGVVGGSLDFDFIVLSLLECCRGFEMDCTLDNELHEDLIHLS